MYPTCGASISSVVGFNGFLNAVSNFCRAIVERKPLRVYGDGSAIRAWCFVSDLVDAVMSILVTPEAAGQAFNIGNPREVETTLGLARRIAQLQHGAKIETQAIDRAEVRVRIPNIERARQILKFEPKVSLYQGLRETLAWFQKESKTMTQESEMPLTLSVPEAGKRYLGISRNAAYDAAARGEEQREQVAAPVSHE